jgi:hypothetical protein
MSTAPLTWDAAVDAAYEPTDLDRKFHQPGNAIFDDNRIGPDGKLTRYDLIRHRATVAYITAHEGEVARVRYTNPNHPSGRGDGVRAIHSTTGALRPIYVRYIEFSPDADTLGNGNRHREGFLVGDTVVPFDGVCEVRVDGDRGVVTL